MKKYLILIAMLLSLGATNVYAQCPPDSLPGPVSPMGSWIDNGCDTILIPKWDDPEVLCPWRVCYCWRAGGVAAPYVEIYIYGHARLDPPACDPFQENSNHSSILFKNLYKQNPSGYNWPCPPCDPGPIPPNTRLTVSGCRTIATPHISCGSCCYYCTTDYTICCDEYGNETITHVSSGTVGTVACPSGCEIGPCDPP